MITRLILERGEWKLLVASANIRTRIKRFDKESSSPKEPLKYSLEAPQVPSPSVEIEEVQIAQEAEVIEGVQATKVELESKAKISSYEETHENFEEEDVKRDFKEMQRMVKVMYEAFIAEKTREFSKPPDGEGSSYIKKGEEKS